MNVGTVAPGASFSIPGNSITTLHSQDVTKTVRHTPDGRIYPVQARRRPMRVYTLDGRLTEGFAAERGRAFRVVVEEHKTSPQLLLKTR